jgi:hypothetical protein
MSETCRWLHCQLERFPLIRFPFNLKHLPLNGIYFIYEVSELWGHGERKRRIVRIGTHREGNFGKRIKEHFLLGKDSFEIDPNKPKYADRSIFRKNIGRALLNRDNDGYLRIWNIDFTNKENRERFSHCRNAVKEERIETEISNILRNNFQFRFVAMDIETERIGSKGIESSLIGTLSHCELCKPSLNWLGKFSPVKEIQNSGLWLKQHLSSDEISEKEKAIFRKAVQKTMDWLHKEAL